MKKLLVVFGPSGIGKSFLAHELLNRHSGMIENGRLYTTREPRNDEETPDRIFVSEEAFVRKKSELFIREKFHNHWYGFPNELIHPQDKHVIINAWPALLPRFLTLPQVFFIGLTIDPDHISLLENRLAQRGYTPEQMSERMNLIKEDVADLAAYASEFELHGKIFTVKNDGTIPDEVVPWVEKIAL